MRDGAVQSGNNQEAKGRLNFFIMDATRVNGLDLTQKNIQERISAVQVDRNANLFIFFYQKLKEIIFRRLRLCKSVSTLFRYS